jgi:hypothetical protein
LKGKQLYYYYDADGRRVRRVAGSSGEMWHVYGMDGELLAEYAYAGQGQAAPPPAAPLKEYGYRSGQLLVTAERVAPGAPPVPAGVSNAGFEVPALGVGGYQYNPANAAWTFTGNAGVTANSSAFTAGNPAAPEGLRVAFVQQTGRVSQVVSFPATALYTVKVRAVRAGRGADTDAVLRPARLRRRAHLPALLLRAQQLLPQSRPLRAL